jgi:hypothetical protein
MANPATLGLPRSVRRRLQTDRALRAWLVAWVGGSVLGIANGVIREVVYKDRVGELTANQISAATLIALLVFYFWLLERRWPLPTLRTALAIGAIWAVLTVLFEFGFGYCVDRKSWSELFANYNLADGNLWTLVLVWIAFGPAVIRALHKRWS